MPAFSRSKLWVPLIFLTLLHLPEKKSYCVSSHCDQKTVGQVTLAPFFTVLYIQCSKMISQYPSVIPRLSLWRYALKTLKSLLCMLCSIWIQQEKGAIRKTVFQPCSTKIQNTLGLQKNLSSFHLHLRDSQEILSFESQL